MNPQLQEIKERLSITEVLSDYIQLKKAGVNFKAVCPFHNEKTPSLIVSPAKQIWHCFGCGQGGDIFEFIKLAENVEFRDALKILADRAGVELRKPTEEEVKYLQAKADLYEINDQACKYYSKVLWESESAKEALNYLKKRGLTDKTIVNWRLGFAPDDFHYLENFLAKKYSKADVELAGLIIKKDGRQNEYFDRFRDRIMFPILNIHGQVVGFTGRLMHEKENAGKYINSPETPVYNKSHELYGLYQAKNIIRKENRCVLMEGNMDVISSHQAGYAQAVASSGTALTQDQFLVLKRFCDNLIFAFDTDSAGSAATKRALEIALNLGFNVKIVQIKGAKDPDELIKKGVGLWQKTVETASNFVEFFFDKTFKEWDADTIDGKREITKELAPLIFRITEPVVKAHFVRKLANGLNVAETSIWDIINRLNVPKRPASTSHAATGPRKSRREVLIDQVLGLSLLTNNDQYLKDLGLEIPKEPDRRELLTFAAQTEMTQQNLDAATELAKTSAELKKLMLKSRMAEVSQELQNAEKDHNKDLQQKLSLEFTKLTQQIRGLN